jgi:hypothetical protein
MTARFLIAALAALGVAGPLRAQPVEAEYAVIQSGFTVMEVRITLDVADGRYRIATLSRPRGIGRLFLPQQSLAEAEGGLVGPEIRPARYRAESDWRGVPRRTLLEFVGRTPRLAVLEPPEGPDRLPVRPEEAEGALDTLSALLRLSRHAAATAGCDLDGQVFDGRRRLAWSSRTLGTVRPPMRHLSGQALHCALESRLVGGFRRTDDPAQAGRPRQAEAWLGVVGPGQPPLPLRVELPSTFLGAFRLDLVRAGPSGP